jgi:hypothetical protein
MSGVTVEFTDGRTMSNPDANQWIIDDKGMLHLLKSSTVLGRKHDPIPVASFQGWAGVWHTKAGDF